MDTIKIRINQIALELGYKEEDLPEMLSKRLNCKVTDLNEIKLVRRSIDARSRQSAPHYVVSVELSFSGSQLPKNVNDNVTIIKEPLEEPRIQLSPDKKLNGTRPIIVGAGPAGLMAALSLAEAGLRPLLIERGAAVEERTKQVFQFGKNGIFNEESNILFGEGGAGLFSDGKLTSRSKDRPRVKRFLESLVRCGAPRSILIDSEPHIGSDVLVKIVPRLRQLIIDSGGEVQFNSCLEQLFINKGQLQAIQVSGQNLPTQACILATGHSARDIFRMLASAGLPLEAKSFAMGVRVEIPQVKINQTQWHEWANHPHLGAASFRVTQKEQAGSRSCYSFCMCPGGLVIACASSFGKITTNGMSLSARDELFANAAFLVPVRPEDITATGSVEPPILDSFKYQEVIEEKAF
ncbi:MAG: FAD-binding protein, partial [Proteobacteria bacterium]|nr:FAD-binding protein [Pseudomonadota bacterium]